MFYVTYIPVETCNVKLFCKVISEIQSLFCDLAIVSLPFGTFLSSPQFVQLRYQAGAGEVTQSPLFNIFLFFQAPLNCLKTNIPFIFGLVMQHLACLWPNWVWASLKYWFQVRVVEARLARRHQTCPHQLTSPNMVSAGVAQVARVARSSRSSRKGKK